MFKINMITPYSFMAQTGSRHANVISLAMTPSPKYGSQTIKKEKGIQLNRRKEPPQKTLKPQ